MFSRRVFFRFPLQGAKSRVGYAPCPIFPSQPYSELRQDLYQVEHYNLRVLTSGKAFGDVTMICPTLYRDSLLHLNGVLVAQFARCILIFSHMVKPLLFAGPIPGLSAGQSSWTLKFEVQPIRCVLISSISISKIASALLCFRSPRLWPSFAVTGLSSVMPAARNSRSSRLPCSAPIVSGSIR